MKGSQAGGHGGDCESIAHQLHEERPHRHQHTQDVAHALRRALRAAGISGSVTSRLKTPCSTQDKLVRRGVALADLHDVCGVRIVVDDVETCYRSLEVVHRTWPHLPEALDDYIAHPKRNGYQSIHTVVRLPCRHTLEIQIRTKEHHQRAETGPAAHWRYKRTAAAEEETS